MFGTRLGRTIRVGGCTCGLLSRLSLGAAVLLLRALVRFCVALRLGSVRVSRWLANLCLGTLGRRGDGRLLVLDGPQALCRFLPALGVVEFDFLRAQSVVGLPRLDAYAAQAVLYSKALVAHRLFLLAPGCQRLAFACDTVTLRLSMRCCRRRCGVCPRLRGSTGRSNQHRHH